MTTDIMDLPTVLVTDILRRQPPSSSLVARLVCKDFCTLSPVIPSVCIDIEVEEDGTVSDMAASFPAATSVRLRTCMQHLHGGKSTRDQLTKTINSILSRLTRLHAIELRGPLAAMLMALELAGSNRNVCQQVREVTLVNVHWDWDHTDTEKDADPVTVADSDTHLLSLALGSLTSLQRLSFQGLSVNTTRFHHLTSIAGCSMTNLDRQDAGGPYDWENGSLARLRSLQTFDVCGAHDPHACKLLSHMTNLNRLKMFSTMHPETLGAMTALVHLHISILPNADLVLPSMRHLEVNRLGNSQCLRLRQMTPNLECLEFRSCADVGDLLANLPASLNSISPLTSLTKHQPHLYHLGKITRLAMCLSCGHTPAMLQPMPLLSSFSLAATDFKNADNCRNLGAFLTGLQAHRLVQLQLVCFDLTSDLVDLSGLAGLTRLELRGCTCTAAALKGAVASLPSLTSLSLRHCRGLSKSDAQDVEHSAGVLQFRVEFVGRVPFLPKYRFA